MPPKVQPRRQPPRGSKGKEVDDNASKPVSTKASLGVISDAQTDNAQSEVATNDNMQNVSSNLDPQRPSENSIAPNATSNLPSVTPNAGSPPRRSVQRLASLHSRNPVTPVSNPIVPETSGSRLKIQPKSSLRRSKEIREALEKAEVERRQSKITTENDPNSSLGNRGGFTGRGRGGRGLFPGNRLGGDRGSQATGHLGGGTIGDEGNRKKKNSRGALLSGMLRSSSHATATSIQADLNRALKETAVKSEKDKDGEIVVRSSSAKKGQVIKQEDLGLANVSSDEEPDLIDGPRINIEHINLISDEEPEDELRNISNKVGGSSLHQEPKIPNWSLKPIRIDRHEHIDRTMGVSADASSLTSAELRRRAKEKGEAEGSLSFDGDEEPGALKPEKQGGRKKPKDVEFLRDERRWKGVYQDEEDQIDEQKIKDEPVDHEEPVIVDNIDQTTAPPQSQSMNANILTSEVAATHENEETVSRSKRVRRDQGDWTRLIKPVLQTEEDHQEWARYENDLQLLKAELGPASVDPVNAPITSTVDEDGVITLAGGNEDIKDKKEDLVYLFQFPPIIPGLSTLAEKEAQAKAEEEPLENPPNAKSDANIKAKNASDTPENNPLVSSFSAINFNCPTGKIGTMSVYDTGRVKVDWGGTSMELGRGGAGGSLQEVVMTDWKKTVVKVEDDGSKRSVGSGSGEIKREEGKEKEKREEKIDVGDKAWAVGEIAGGFVMTPDWAKMLDE